MITEVRESVDEVGIEGRNWFEEEASWLFRNVLTRLIGKERMLRMQNRCLGWFVQPISMLFMQV